MSTPPNNRRQRRSRAKPPSEHKKDGRPELYRAQYATMVFGYAVAGYTDAEMAEFFGVSLKTFHNWKLRHPKFLHSIRKGKEPYNAKMAVSVAEMGTGYEYVEEVLAPGPGGKIVKLRKWQPGNITAAKFFLTNRMPKVWRDKQETAIVDPNGHNAFDSLAVEIAKQIVKQAP